MFESATGSQNEDAGQAQPFRNRFFLAAKTSDSIVVLI
jgi:hypothetical protein